MSRTDPPLHSPTYAVRAPLAAWLAAEGRRAPSSARVLDVGCGGKPYQPFFAHVAAYVGVDVDNPHADLEGTAEELPVPDASFDVVLCTQVLEHAADPAKTVRELARATKPGGRVLASTHGVQVYHPNPVDLWRWTHAGLERLFADNGEWRSLTVRPGSGTAACVGMVVAIYVDLAARRAGVPPIGRGAVSVINRAARALDRRSPLLAQPGPGTLFANYQVTAER
jgi:SAM-dependent methyltransferase